MRNILDKKSFPDFVVIGAMRAGTTSLYHMMKTIDQICLSDYKETNYFIDYYNYGKGDDWYRRQFSNASLMCGDISPAYSAYKKFPGIPKRIYSHAPDAKLIFIQRDPVSRAKSHYYLNWSHNKRLPAPEVVFRGTELGEHILSCSQYMRQMEGYLEYFSQRQILIVDFELIRSDPIRLLEGICHFLGIELENMQLESANLRNSNSSLELSETSDWWIRVSKKLHSSDSSLLKAIMGCVPGQLLVALRRHIATKEVDLPVFTDSLEQEIAEYLAADISSFKKFCCTHSNYIYVDRDSLNS